MTVDPALQQAWQDHPAQSFRLIIRVSLALDEAEEQLRLRGIRVRRRCRLIQGFVVECSGASALALAQEPWIISAELDREVRTFISADTNRNSGKSRGGA